MRIESLLTAFCDMLRTELGTEVTLGLPDDSVPGIYVWPWRLETDPHLKNIPKPAGATPGSEHRTAPVDIHLLVFATPVLSSDGLSHLDETLEAIAHNPILNVGETAAAVILNPLPCETLSSLFSAARIPLVLCLSAVLKENK